MPALCDVIQAEEENSEDVGEEDKPENDPLYLPSSYSKDERGDFNLNTLAVMEMQMRRCSAESELEILKLSIRLLLVDFNGKRSSATGIAANTRANAKIAKDVKRRDKHMHRYNTHYDAMLRLGYEPERDPHGKNFFQRITRETMDTIKKVGEAPQLGDGRKPEAWFWREGKDVALISNRSDKELQTLNEEERRVRYFRMWANWKRWEEEWHILGAEFDRTVRSFGKMASVWRAVGEKMELEVQSGLEKHEQHMARLHELSKEKGVLTHGAMRTLQNIGATQGRRAYAYKKASVYEWLKSEATKAWSVAGAYDNGRGWDGWTAPVPGEPGKKRAIHVPIEDVAIEG